MMALGLDLAGVETKPTGYGLLEKATAKTLLFHKDTEILSAVQEDKPEIGAIDAPLTLPPVEESSKKERAVISGHATRSCSGNESGFFPILWGR
jgi:predicted nuclease with RNAse H fold